MRRSEGLSFAVYQSIRRDNRLEKTVRQVRGFTLIHVDAMKSGGDVNEMRGGGKEGEGNVGWETSAFKLSSIAHSSVIKY